MVTHGPIEHHHSVSIVKYLLKPELAASWKEVHKNVGILRTISAPYNDRAFWLSLNLGFKLNCLAWFKSPDGKVALQKQWDLYHYSRAADRKKSLDTAPNPLMMETGPIPVPQPRKTALDWADSEDPEFTL